MVIKNVTIVGLGAIGMVYATAFQSSEVALRVAMDRKRKERHISKGVLFNKKEYHFDYFTPSSADSPADLIIITTKSYALDSALELIAPIVGENTLILPLLNGITSEEICAKRFGWERVLYGYFLGHTATRNENHVTQDGYYTTYFGDSSNRELSENIVRVKEFFSKTSIPYIIPEDMINSLWQKFIINIGMNQATALLRCNYGHIQNSENARNYMIALMEEAAEIAIKTEIQGAETMVEKAVAVLYNLSPEDGSSMYQDVIYERQTEVDIFADTVSRLGLKHGIETPHNNSASKILHALLIE